MDDPGGEDDLDLETFLDMLPHLEPADLMAVSAAYQQADAAERDAARAAAAAAAKKSRRGDELNRLQGSIIQWAGSDIPQSGPFTFANPFRPDQMLGELRVQAVPALLDAATVLLLGHALDEEARDTLLRPWWSAVMET
jgi:hypothetical protein